MSSNDWKDIHIKNTVHPNYHEFYGIYSNLAKTVAKRGSLSRPLTSEIDFMGFGSEKSFKTALTSETETIDNKRFLNKNSRATRTPDVSIKEEPTIRIRKPRDTKEFDEEKYSIKVETLENYTEKKSETVSFSRRQDEEEADELFNQLKNLVPNTLTITLLQTAMALIKAGISENLSNENVKKEKPDIKPEPSSPNFVKSRKTFFTLGKNRHLHKFKMIKKKGQFQTKNLLKFEIDRCS
ncbi:hypothetical protein ACFFRR_002820 [Megaselia abdita]